jgi:hypothetical protein
MPQIKILIMNSAFVKYLRMNWSAFWQYVSYLRTRRELMIHRGGRFFLSCSHWAWRPSETRDTLRPTQFPVTQLEFEKLKKKSNNGISVTSAEFFFAGKKAQWDEGCGRILLGDNRRRAAMLPPIGLICVEVWISAAFSCMYEGRTVRHEHINFTTKERYQ